MEYYIDSKKAMRNNKNKEKKGIEVKIIFWTSSLPQVPLIASDSVPAILAWESGQVYATANKRYGIRAQGADFFRDTDEILSCIKNQLDKANVKLYRKQENPKEKTGV